MNNLRNILAAGALMLSSAAVFAEDVQVAAETFDGEITSWSWSAVDLSSDRNWFASSRDGREFAQMNGFGGDTDSNDWLVSTQYNLTGLDNDYVYIQFESALNFNGPQLKLLVSTDFADDVTAATWTELTEEVTWSTGSYAWVESGKVDLSSYIGQTITIAFQYISNDAEGAALWRIDNFSLINTTENPSLIFNDLETFDSSLGDWTAISVASDFTWEQTLVDTDGVAQMSGAGDSEFSNDWLVSKTYDMSLSAYPFLQFENAKDLDGDQLRLFVSSDYDGDVTAANWIELTNQVNWSAGSAEKVFSGRLDFWTIFSDASGERDLEALSSVTVAFQYTSSEAGAAIWQLDNLEVGSDAPGVFENDVTKLAQLETFDEELGDWTVVNLSGSKLWLQDTFNGAYFAEMSGFRDDADSNDWLISPTIDYDTLQNRTISFYNATRFGGPQLKVLVSGDFDGDVTKSTWIDISDRAVWSQGDFEWIYSGVIDVSDLVTAKATFAFQYTSDDTGAATWQIDQVNIGNASTARPRDVGYTTYEIEEFNDSFGLWTTVSIASDKDWTTSAYVEKTFAEISGFRGDVFSNDWLVSPTINTTQADWDNAFVQFNNSKRFDGDQLKLLVSTNYTGDVQTASWTDITDDANWSEGDSEWVDSGEVDLTRFIGENITVAFQYTSSAAGAPTWRVEYVQIVEVDDGFSDSPAVVPRTKSGTTGLLSLVLLMVLAGIRRRFI
ncbi:MAG: DUF5017 domain-containing protein [Gammaproteobacteria bacterium]|nr:DUF5017 domain-containing protein [Gammaproteobacteria bacterium]